jgi:hypothetical protein
MAVGKDFIMRVESHLDLKVGKTMKEIRNAVTSRGTPRAFRYAVSALVREGKARRDGSLVFAAKDLTVDIHEKLFGPATGRAPLAECFPDDTDGYLGAKSDLLHHGSHHGGGGAAAEYYLKLAEAA